MDDLQWVVFIVLSRLSEGKNKIYSKSCLWSCIELWFDIFNYRSDMNNIFIRFSKLFQNVRNWYDSDQTKYSRNADDYFGSVLKDLEKSRQVFVVEILQKDTLNCKVLIINKSFLFQTIFCSTIQNLQCIIFLIVSNYHCEYFFASFVLKFPNLNYSINTGLP